MSEQIQHVVVGPVAGIISGKGIIRDKFGNIKGEITLGGPVSQGEKEALQEAGFLKDQTSEDT